jgi:hypothetical protein
VSEFLTHNKKDNSEKTCKFCGQHVWWHQWKNRWYNPGGEVVHTETCEKRRAHYKAVAAEVAETKRSRRPRYKDEHA